MRRFAWPALSVLLIAAALTAAQDGDWTAYGRDAGGERFSPLDQIHAGNVGSLQIAWTYHTGDAFTPADGRPTAFEATPLVVDGILYLSTPLGQGHRAGPGERAAALGVRREGAARQGYGDFASRGVSLWRRGSQRRIIVATVDARLIALDAGTGRPVASFGDNGTVDLRRGLRVPPTGFADYEVTSPPAIVNDTIVVGSGIADGTSKPHPSGEVRGFDAVSGTLKWSWDPVPQDRGGTRRRLVGQGDRVAYRRRERVVGDRRRSGAQSRVRADQQPEQRLLRRRAARRQPVLGLGRRAARRHRGARLALPDRAPRPVGLRRGLAAAALRLAQGRPHGAGGGDRVEDRAPVHPRSHHRYAADSGGGAAGAGERRARREQASPTQPFPAAPPALGGVPADRGSGVGRHRCGSAVVPRRHAAAARGRTVHAAVAHRARWSSRATSAGWRGAGSPTTASTIS